MVSVLNRTETIWSVHSNMALWCGNLRCLSHLNQPVNDWTVATNDKKFAVIAYIDYAKAFYYACLSKLTIKVQDHHRWAFELDKKLPVWQITVCSSWVGQCCSGFIKIISGVVQGVLLACYCLLYILMMLWIFLLAVLVTVSIVCSVVCWF